MNAARKIIGSLRARAATATSSIHVYLIEDSELDEQAADELERLMALVERVHDGERHWTVALTVAATGTTDALTANRRGGVLGRAGWARTDGEMP